MAFSLYADLKTDITSYLARDDLTAYYDDFITLFEAAAARRLRIRILEASTNLTPSSGSVTLPADYLGWRRVTWTGDVRVDLDYVHPSALQAYYPDTPSGTPTVFTIEGSTLKVRPTSATTLEFDYFAKSTALVSTLNALYANNPDLYLAGSLFEAYMFDKDPNNGAPWKMRRDEIFDELDKSDFRNAGALTIRVAGATP